MGKVSIYGFGLIKNGVKFDFPFQESISSMLPVTDKVFYNYGPCEDSTLDVLKSFPSEKLVICEKSWDDNRTDGGHILSDMTNYALNSLRSALNPITDKDAWAIYLQSDEIFHENDLELLKSDIQKANDNGNDALKFRYLHFWQSHNKIAVNKKWYPHEVRAIKVFQKDGANIESWGDAQGFRNFHSPMYTETTIYHYGHVREEKAYEEKMDRMRQYYHPKEGFEKFVRKWKKKDENTITLNFYGTHPKVMKERMDRLGGIFSKKNQDAVAIFSKDKVSAEFKSLVKAEKVFINENPENCLKVNLDYSKIDNFLGKTKVPKGMFSKLAIPWEKEFYWKMKLYEHGIGTK